MAIRLDTRARAAIARRCARGQDAALLLRLEALPARGVLHVLSVNWLPRRRTRRPVVERRVGDVTIYVGARVARYTTWHDITISEAWHVGPLAHLVVVDEPRVLLEMQSWEQTHPGLKAWQAA